MQVYVNPKEISASFTVTNADGSPNSEVIPLYEGDLLAEFKITDVAELGGQLVSKVVDLSGLESGTYHIWVRADDGINPPATSYAAAPALLVASGEESVYGLNVVWMAKNDYNLANEIRRTQRRSSLTVRAASQPSGQQRLRPPLMPPPMRLMSKPRVNAHPDVDSYTLRYGNTALNPTEVITVGRALAVLDANGNPTGVEVGFVRLTNIRPNQPYFISIEAIDSESGRSVRSQEVPFTIASAAFSLSSQQTTVAVAVGGSVSCAGDTQCQCRVFFPNVWLSADLGGTPPGVTASFAGDAEGFPGLNSAAPTRQLDNRVDSSVPDGIYPIVISGYNGDVKEALTLQLVVGKGNTVTNSIYLPLVSR